eukprot:48102-Eustigmatos_ZCMA.PRE.1
MSQAGADHACEDASLVPGPNEVWCFAYGANMSPAVLSRRKVNPLRSFRAEVEDPDLVILFDHTDGEAACHLTVARRFSTRACEFTSPCSCVTDITRIQSIHEMACWRCGKDASMFIV